MRRLIWVISIAAGTTLTIPLVASRRDFSPWLPITVRITVAPKDLTHHPDGAGPQYDTYELSQIGRRVAVHVDSEFGRSREAEVGMDPLRLIHGTSATTQEHKRQFITWLNAIADRAYRHSGSERHSFQFGFPLPFMSRERVMTRGQGTQNLHAFIVQPNPWPSRRWIIPTRVVWHRFFLNTLAFALPIWLVFAVAERLRASFRVTRGRCGACRHLLGGSMRCPECGTPRRRPLVGRRDDPATDVRTAPTPPRAR